MRQNEGQTSEKQTNLWHFASMSLGILLVLIMVTGLLLLPRSIDLPVLHMRNVSLDCLGMVVSVIIYLSGLRNREENREKQFFMWLVAVNVFYLNLDEICWLIHGDPTQNTLNMAANTGFYLISIIMSWMFWYFVGNWKGQKTEFYNKAGWIINIAALVSAAIIFLNIKGEFIFSISEDGTYARTGTYWISLIGPGLMLLLTAVQTILRRGPLIDKLILLSYPVLPLVASVMGAFREGPTMLSVYVFVSIVFNYSNLYVRRAEERSKVEGKLTRSELNAMMLQINPHFIYNTLGSAASLCDIDPSAAQELIYKFSDYLRDNFTDINKQPLVRFREELEHLNHYIAIEKVRFPNIEVEYELETQDFSIPTFTLQPLVENAIKHGICKRRKSAGTIWIETMETETDYLVRVIDDGIGFSYVAANLDEGKHIGIQNVRTRLEILCGGTLTIDGELGVGTSCEITIPKKAE